MLCKRNHYYQEWDECPFCCALDNTEPKTEDEFFLMAYNAAKGKSSEDVKRLCESIHWPEEDITDLTKKFG